MASTTPTTHVAPDRPAREAIHRRLRRVEGQVRGITRMVEEDRYCIDVLQQITAAQAALDKIALELADDHTRHCILGGDAEDREALQAELMTALGRLVGRR
jgi:DNA-binding FrmR family transcriptional regulator